MSINWKRFNRKVHYWGSIIIAIPILIVIISGLLLLLKKDVEWIQPSSASGQGIVPTISMNQILEQAKSTPELKVNGWSDIDRIDLRPDKGILKIRSHNRWEAQLDHQTGELLHLAYRRSDFIESLHDGSFFHTHAKLWIFLPAAIILFVLWVTGMVLFLLPMLSKKKSRKSVRKFSRTITTSTLKNPKSLTANQ